MNPLIQTNPTKEVYFSRNDYEPYDFSRGHSDQTLYIILDQNTELYKNEIKINNNNLEVKIVSVNTSDIFTFRKPSTDIVTIYYCYYSNGTNPEDDSFSLIDKINSLGFPHIFNCSLFSLITKICSFGFPDKLICLIIFELHNFRIDESLCLLN